jgi:hypothetical protein
MLEKLWNDIRLIYDGFNFSSRDLVNDLMIISKDNYKVLTPFLREVKLKEIGI